MIFWNIRGKIVRTVMKAIEYCSIRERAKSHVLMLPETY